MSRLTRMSPTFLLIALILLGLLGYGNFTVWRQWQQGKLLDRQGLTTQATVTETRVRRGSRGIGQNYFVDYRLPPTLDPAGTIHSATVNESMFQAARTQGTLIVQYLPSQPSVQRPAAVSSDRSTVLWFGLLNLIVFGLAALIFKGV